MPTVYLAQDSQGRRFEYRDRKRAAWGLSILYPLIPFMGIGLHAATGHPGWLALPLAIMYLGGPLLDWGLGEDENNPPEAVVPQLEADRYYRWLTYAVVPLHFVALIGCAVWAATQPMPVWAQGLLAVVAGMTSGLGINTGHELGHKQTEAGALACQAGAGGPGLWALSRRAQPRPPSDRGHAGGLRQLAHGREHLSLRTAGDLRRHAPRVDAGESSALRAPGTAPGARTTRSCSPMPSRSCCRAR